MARKKRNFDCTVINEPVKIFLHKRQRGIEISELIVRCDQSECQYVDKNELPCLLNIDMFEDEIREQKEIYKKRFADQNK